MIALAGKDGLASSPKAPTAYISGYSFAHEHFPKSTDGELRDSKDGICFYLPLYFLRLPL